MAHHSAAAMANPDHLHHHLQNPNMAHMAPVATRGGDHGSDDGSSTMDMKPPIGIHDNVKGDRGRGKEPRRGGAASSDVGSKQTKGRVKIKMEFIDDKVRRYTTFSKRKTGIMKKVSGWMRTTSPQSSTGGANCSVGVFLYNFQVFRGC